MSMDEIERIRRRHKHARPSREMNPAWYSCHQDRGVLLQRCEQLATALASTHFHHKTLIPGCPECDKYLPDGLKPQ